MFEGNPPLVLMKFSTEPAEKYSTDFFVKCYQGKNEKEQLMNIWAISVVKNYSDGDFLISIYQRKEDEIRNMFLSSDSVYSTQMKEWVTI